MLSQCSGSSHWLQYYVASALFPAHNTMIDDAIYDDAKGDEKVVDKMMATTSEAVV